MIENNEKNDGVTSTIVNDDETNTGNSSNNNFAIDLDLEKKV